MSVEKLSKLFNGNNSNKAESNKRCDKMFNSRLRVFVLFVLIILLAVFAVGVGADDNGLIAHYEFEGNVLDSAGDNNGVNHGAEFVEGIEGQVAYFDGDSYVRVEDSDSLDITDEITISLWVNRGEESSYQRLVAKYYWDTENYGSYHTDIRDNDQVMFLLNLDGSWTELRSTKVIELDEWVHLAFVYDGTEMKIYWNGVLDNSVSASGNIVASDLDVGIGTNFKSNGDHQQRFNGNMDVVKIYSRALSAEEIRVEICDNNGVCEEWETNANCANDCIIKTYEVYEPVIERNIVYNGKEGALKYNHDSTTAFFKGVWFASWNGNTDLNEGQPGQLNYVATSTDFESWSVPFAAYSDSNYSSNPVLTKNQSLQWQPNFVVVGEELWSLWSIDHGVEYDKAVYLSNLSEPNGKWENHPVLINGSPYIYINSTKYNLFPSQNPIVLSTGRVLVPVIVRGLTGGFFGQEKLCAVLYTDDNGITWEISNTAKLPGDSISLWEPNVHELDDGSIVMLARNLDRKSDGGNKCDPSTKMLLTSKSIDQGETWDDFSFVPIETVSARMHVVKSGNRYILTHSDYRRCEPDGFFLNNEDRRNLALFFSRDGESWIAGNRYTDEETFVTCPQMFVNDNNLHIIYSYNNLDIRSVVIKQLPEPDKNYIFPRQNTDPIIPEYSIEPEKSGFAFSQDIKDLSGIFNIKVYELQGSMAIIDSRGLGNEFYFILKETLDKKSMRPCISVGGNEQCAENLVIQKNVYASVGFGVSDGSKLYLFVNDEIEHLTPDKLRLSENQFTIGGKNSEASSLQDFIGEISSGRFYTELLSEEQIHLLLQGKSIDAQEYGDLLSYETPVLDPVLSRVEHNSENLIFYGEGSAGIEVGSGDSEISFSFFVPASTEEKITIFTAGDGDNPFRLVYNGDKISAEYLDQVYSLSGLYECDSWHEITLKFGEETIIESESGSLKIINPIRFSMPYFGEGYPQNAASPESSFMVNINSIKVRQELQCNNNEVCDAGETIESCSEDCDTSIQPNQREKIVNSILANFQNLVTASGSERQAIVMSILTSLSMLTGDA